MRTIVCVEGGIGFGKSTACEQVARITGVPLHLEPVDKWRAHTYNGLPLLEAMYSGAVSKLNFQLAIFGMRVSEIFALLSQSGSRVVLTERSPWSERYVFAEPQMETEDYNLYLFAQKHSIAPLMRALGPLRVIFVHMDLPTEHAMQRIKRRNRPEENGVTAELMDAIAAAHASMERRLQRAQDLEFSVKEVHHVHVDATKPAAEVAADIAAVVRGALDRVAREEREPPPASPATELVLTP
jgi:deoxyadenosine/deoxycytidine kinase